MWIKIYICLVLVIFSSLAEESDTKKKPAEVRDKRNLEYQITHPFAQSPHRSERRISNISPPRYSNLNHFPGKTYTYFRKGTKLQNQPLPPYAVQMEPLVHYSQKDPLYDPNTFHLLNPPYNELTKPDDLITDNNRLAEQFYGPPKQYIERPVYIKEPEPIIEIIIKEANTTAAPPPAVVLPQKKKKEEVQVFYVKYKKNPHGMGKDSVIYDKPIPALSPVQGESSEDHEEHGYAAEYPVTAAPPATTTIRAIIKPDSETYHAQGGIHVTFGGNKHSPQAEKYDDDIVESAPQPAVSHPGSRRFPEVLSTNQEYRPEIRAPQPYRPFNFNQQSQQRLPQNFGSKTGGFGRSPPINQNLPSKNIPEFSRPPQNRPYQFEQRPSQSTFQFPRPQTHFPIQQQHQSIINQQPPNAIRSNQFFNGENKQNGFSNQFNNFGNQNFNHHSQQFINTAQYKTQHTVSHSTQNSNNNQHQPFSQENGAFKQQLNVNNPPIFTQQSQFSSPSQGPPQNIHRDQPIQHQFPSTHTQFSQNKQNQNEFPPFIPSSTSGVLQNQELQNQQYSSITQGKTQQQFSPSINHFPQNKLNQGEFQQTNYNPASGILQNQEKRNQQFFSGNHGTQSNSNQNQQFPLLSHGSSQYLNQQNREHQSQFGFPQNNPQALPLVQHNTQFKQEKFVPPGGELIAAVPKFEQHISIPPKRDHLSANEFSQQIQQQFKDLQLNPSQNYHFSTQVTTTPKSAKVNYYTPTAPSTRRSPTTTTTTTTTTTQKPESTTTDLKALNIQLPDEVPDDLREQLLSSGILKNAQISVLDYDKVGDIPISALPPDQLANFYGAGGAQQIAAGSEKKETLLKPPAGFKVKDQEVDASEHEEAKVKQPVEMKVVHYDPQTRQGQEVQESYVKNDATRTDPVVLNDQTYNRYLPLKVSGAKFPIPEVPELKGKNITSVVVLAPIDYNFSKQQRFTRDASNIAKIKYLKNEALKKLLDNPTSENYKNFLELENKTSSNMQSVILLVTGSGKEREIYLYDVNTRNVSKLDGELSTAFVDAAETNASSDLKKPNPINDNSFASSNLVETKVLPPDNIDSYSNNDGDEPELEAAASDLYESRVPIIDPMKDDLEAEGSEQLERFVDISSLNHEDLVSAADSNENVYISSGYSKTEHQMPSK